jgi:hypothetical protein
MSQDTMPTPHEWGCKCKRCKNMIAAILAQDSSGEYFFTDYELTVLAEGSGSGELSMSLWAGEWISRNLLDGVRRHLLHENSVPKLFKTRRECREWIKWKYGYIKIRPVKVKVLKAWPGERSGSGE